MSKKVDLTNILVVDDISHYRVDAENVLSALGCNVVTAVDGEDAWQKIIFFAEQNTPFDMIVSDWQMPKLDGIGLLKKVRDSEYREVVFILLTTEPQASAVKQARELYKPDAVLGKLAQQHKDLFKIYIDAHA